jgi:hypothetical protein
MAATSHMPGDHSKHAIHASFAVAKAGMAVVVISTCCGAQCQAMCIQVQEKEPPVGPLSHNNDSHTPMSPNGSKDKKRVKDMQGVWWSSVGGGTSRYHDEGRGFSVIAEPLLFSLCNL